jgi:hypothetical protein
MSKVKNFILEMLKALALGAGKGRSGGEPDDIQDIEPSALIKENTEIIKRSNAFSENAAIELDSIYNILATNKNLFNQNAKTSDVTPVFLQSPIPNIDSFFDSSNPQHIPIKVLNAAEIGAGGGSWWDDLFDWFGKRKKKTPRPRPGGRPGPRGGTPGGGGPAGRPRIAPGTTLPSGYTRNAAGRIINSTTGRFASAEEILDELEKGKWARYTKLMKFLRAAGYVGVAMAFIDPIYAMYSGAPESEIKKQLAGAMGSIGGGVLGAIIGAAGITAIPVVGQTGIANIAGGIVGGIVGAFAGEWLIESLVEYLFDESPEPVERSEPVTSTSMPVLNEIKERAELRSYNRVDNENRDRQDYDVANQKTIEQLAATTPTSNVIKPVSNTDRQDFTTSVIDDKITDNIVPVSTAQNNYYYSETETPINNDIEEELVFEKIHFISELIKFIYNSVGDGSLTTPSTTAPSSIGSPATADVVGAPLMVGYAAPGAGGGGVVSPRPESVTPGGAPMPTPEITGTPTEAKDFLSTISANRSRPGDTSMLNDDFAAKTAALIKAAPAGIREGLGVGSAYRSPQRQAEIIAENMGKYGFGSSQVAAWRSDVSTMGPEAAGAKWRPTFRSAGLTANIGMPGGSKHQHGLAIDLTYNGAFLKPGNVPSNVLSWIHENAGRFGLHFPMGHEPWHIEPVNARADSPPTVMAEAPDDTTIKSPGGGGEAAEIKSAVSASEKSKTAVGTVSEGAKTAVSSASAATTPTSTTPTVSGKKISEKSTETYANAKIPASTPAPRNSDGMTSGAITNASTIDPPYETTGIDSPLPAMTSKEQSIFELSGMV